MDERIYVLSTGRTGTTFLYNFFKTYYPELNITHQTRWSRLMNIAGNLPLRKQQKVWLIQWLFKRMKNEKIPVSTVDPLLSLPIKILIDAGKISDYKVIHLVRDPRTFVPSFMNWKRQSVKRTFLHHVVPFWQPCPLFSGNVSFFSWLFMPKYEHFCWVWHHKNRLFQQLAKENNYLLIRTEDLNDQQKIEESMRSIVSFLSLPEKAFDYSSLREKRINASKQKSFPEWKCWTPKMKHKLIWHCEKLAKELGFLLDK